MTSLGEEVRPGLRTWTAYHEEWKDEVASFALLGEEEAVLIDPLLGEGDWPRLKQAVGDRAPHVLLTIHWHARSAAEVAARFPGTRVWAHARDRAPIARRTPVTDVFKLGDPLPGDLVAIGVRPRTEVLFWEPRSRALIAGDALLGDGYKGEGLHLCPASWLPSSTGPEELRESLRPVLDLPVELVLVSHGRHALEDAKRELKRMLTGAS